MVLGAKAPKLEVCHLLSLPSPYEISVECNWAPGMKISINEVTLRRARLVLGWVTVLGWVHLLGMQGQKPRGTAEDRPPTFRVWDMSTYIPQQFLISGYVVVTVG